MTTSLVIATAIVAVGLLYAITALICRDALKPGRHRPGMASGTVTQTIRDDPTMPIDAATLQGAVR